MFNAITRIPGWHLYMTYLIIAIFILVHIYRSGERRREKILEISLMYIIGIIGARGIFNFFGHTVFADSIAESIGWQVGTPWQTEVAGANLAIGLIGFLGFWRKDFWLPYIIGLTGFQFTAGATHIIEIIQHGNFAPNNIGVLPANFGVPILLIVLYGLWARTGAAPKGADFRPLQDDEPGEAPRSRTVMNPK